MFSRREFLKTVAAGITAVYPFRHSFASQKFSLNDEKSLNMHNIHTGESMNITYLSFGIYDTEALNRINYFLRCHYTNKVKEIDVNLLNILSNIQKTFGNNKQINIISGYRSPEYNEYLRGLGRRVSKNSLHLQGIAIDFEIPGVSNYNLYRVARSFGAGGVGHYPEFVHIDTGRVRYW
jgi:uncharacterized protein YcbK (DUF882 family)